MVKKPWLERLSEMAQLSDEPLPGVPLVEIVGNCRVLIEGHGRITQYSCQEICVKVRRGSICVKGCALEVRCMSQQKLIITGKISGVELCQEER